MSEIPNLIEEKPEFSAFALAEFVKLFQSQNWRIHERKNGNTNRKLLTKEHAWDGALGLQDEAAMDRLLLAAQENKEINNEICYLLAKAMIKDNTDFETTIKNFWFTSKQFAPFKRRTDNAFKKLQKSERNFQNAELLGAAMENLRIMASPDADKYLYAFFVHVQNNEGDHTREFEGILPERYLNIANLLEEEPFEGTKGDKDFRTSVAYRMRTDCTEIIKLASAALDMSATEFVETLILQGTQMLIRGEIGRQRELCNKSPDDKDAHEAMIFARKIYNAMSERYHNDNCEGYFPQRRTHRPPENSFLRGTRAWMPEEEEEREPMFQGKLSKPEAALWCRDRISMFSRSITRSLNELTEINNLSQMILTDEENDDFAPVLNNYTSGGMEAFGDIDSANEATDRRRRTAAQKERVQARKAFAEERTKNKGKS